MPTVSLVEVATTGPVARVTLNRPDQRNALTIPMLEELIAGFGDLAVTSALRAVVLVGAGPDFCAGADLTELERGRSDGTVLDFDAPFRAALRAIAVHPVPVVASVQGRALGGGCQVVLACDLAVAAADARLGIPSARLGVVIPLDSIERLVLAVGPMRANEMLLAGTVVDGATAADWALVSRVAQPDRLADATDEVVRAIVDSAPLSVRAAKRGVGAAIDRATGVKVAGPAVDYEMMAAEAFGSEDLGEGIRAFRERRRPEFRGR